MNNENKPNRPSVEELIVLLLERQLALEAALDNISRRLDRLNNNAYRPYTLPNQVTPLPSVPWSTLPMSGVWYCSSCGHTFPDQASFSNHSGNGVCTQPGWTATYNNHTSSGTPYPRPPSRSKKTKP